MVASRNKMKSKGIGFAKHFGMAVACQKKGLNIKRHSYIS